MNLLYPCFMLFSFFGSTEVSIIIMAFPISLQFLKQNYQIFPSFHQISRIPQDYTHPTITQSSK